MKKILSSLLSFIIISFSFFSPFLVFAIGGTYSYFETINGVKKIVTDSTSKISLFPDLIKCNASLSVYKTKNPNADLTDCINSNTNFGTTAQVVQEPKYTECTFISAGWSPQGKQAPGYFKDNTTIANIIFKTKNCIGYPNMTFTIRESDGTTRASDDVWDKSGLDDKKLDIPSDNFTAKILLGEEDCDRLLTGGSIGSNCDLYFTVNKDGKEIYSSYGEPNDTGMLYYDCDGTCLDNGKFIGIIAQGSNDAPVNIDAQKTSNINNDNTYNLLAPIGGLTKAPDNIGDYFNTILKLAIGLCAVLAVVMIIIGGIQYMGDESVFGKTEAKSQIGAAILGLIIALGSYAILNTINPDLLGKNGITIQAAVAETGEETIGLPGKSTTVAGQNLNVCDPKAIVAADLFGTKIGNVGINKAILPKIQQMNAEYASLPNTSPIKIYVKKGFSISRGYGCTKTSNGNYSAHSYGLALDINGHSTTNPYLKKGIPCKTDMPKEFVAFMKKYGWGWGAAFNDPMHFSMISSEVSQTSNGSCNPI